MAVSTKAATFSLEPLLVGSPEAGLFEYLQQQQTVLSHVWRLACAINIRLERIRRGGRVHVRLKLLHSRIGEQGPFSGGADHAVTGLTYDFGRDRYAPHDMKSGWSSRRYSA